MNSAKITQTREATISVGDTVGYFSNTAVVKNITPHSILIEVDGVEHNISMESFATQQGQNFTLDITVENL